MSRTATTTNHTPPVKKSATHSRSHKQTVGELIKSVRKQQNLRAEVVAEYCNVSRERVFQWERGDFILEKNFEGISEALGISIRRLKLANAKR